MRRPSRPASRGTDRTETRLPLEQEFTVSVTLYSARAWLSDNDTFSQTIWKATRFASSSHARKAIFPVGTVKILNFLTIQ